MMKVYVQYLLLVVSVTALHLQNYSDFDEESTIKVVKRI